MTHGTTIPDTRGWFLCRESVSIQGSPATRSTGRNQFFGLPKKIAKCDVTVVDISFGTLPEFLEDKSSPFRFSVKVWVDLCSQQTAVFGVKPSEFERCVSDEVCWLVL